METQDHQPSSSQLQVRFQALTQENLQLCHQNERLSAKVSYLQSRLGQVSSSNTEVSCRLLQSEEQKLRTSKELVEEKIQMNKMRELFEEEMFELKNRIANQDGVIRELERERDKLLGELQSAEVCLKVGERSGKGPTEEHATLKKSYLALAEAHNKEVAQSEELSAELLSLARAQDALRRQVEEQHQSVQTTTQDLHGELDRVQALISRMSHDRVKPEDLVALNTQQNNMEKTLLGNQDEIKDTLGKMRNSYEEQQQKLEDRIVSMGKEQQEHKRAIAESQQKLSEQSTALLCSRSQVKEAEEEISSLQLRLKRLNEEYRARLVCYLRDIAEYMDGLRGRRIPPDGRKMRAFVDGMLQDVRSSYRAREEQLASAAHTYKKRLQRVTKTHHALLIAYRAQREHILVEPENGLDPGPPEACFSLDPIELRGKAERERQQLRQDEARVEGELQEAREQMAAPKMPVQASHWEAPANLEQLCEESWLDMRKQLKEVTEATIGCFEKERSSLVTRATAAEAQVSQLQDYIDNHLVRYKPDMAHLQRLHGIEETRRPQSTHSSPS